MTKKEFIIQLKKACTNLNHVSKRKLDYKYHEYLLFKILIKHHHEVFKVLGLPNNLNISFFSDKNAYNINARTHVTLNYQLYKLYECGYYSSEKQLVEATLKVITDYTTGRFTIKELDDKLRKQRLEYVKEQKKLNI